MTKTALFSINSCWNCCYLHFDWQRWSSNECIQCHWC